MKIFCLILLFHGIGFSLWSEPHLVTFPMLNNYHQNFINSNDVNNTELQILHDTIEINGFLYKHGQNELILASEPNLKTCCMSSSEKMGTRLKISSQILSGRNVKSNQLVTIQGNILIKPKWSNEGHLQEFFFLENAKLIEKSKIPWLSLGIFAGGLLLSGYIFFIRRKKIEV